jgi:hypothetical protein
VRSWNNSIGKDFALVKIDPGFAVVPGVAGALGPTGVFCGDPVAQPVMHYGHGYVFFVEQGYAKFGEVIPDLTLVFRFTSPNGFNWVGYGLPGDSGSGVMNAAGLAVGDLTHGLAVAGLPVPGLNFGTDMGGSSTSSARATSSSPWTGARPAAQTRSGSERVRQGAGGVPPAPPARSLARLDAYLGEPS